MRILIDMGHPAHVHYFKNFLWEMKRRGHSCLVTARDRGEIFALLTSYGFEYHNRGYGADTQIGKLAYLPRAVWRVYRVAKAFKPDLFLSFGSMYAAQASALVGRPHIAFDDTEFSRKEYYLYAPFTEVICTPQFFGRELGRKQIRFNGLIELCYLHPNRFQPDDSVLYDLGVDRGEKYAVMRFVAFKALHDVGVVGFTEENKIRAVRCLSQFGKVFISSEGPLPEELESHRIGIGPERLHDIISYAAVYLGDSQTTSTEAACLGTPAVRCSTFAHTAVERANFVQLEERYGLLANYAIGDQHDAIEEAARLLQHRDVKSERSGRRAKLLSENIDVTAFMVWLVENYPESVSIMREDSKYQDRFS